MPKEACLQEEEWACIKEIYRSNCGRIWQACIQVIRLLYKNKGEPMDINTLKQVSLSYARAAGAAVVAMYLAGETDPKKLAYAFLAGFVGPVAKYFDKSAKDFGLTK
jgi:hypothetical protein